MYYRVAIRREEDQLNRPRGWQWQSTALSSVQAVLQFLRLYGALPQDHLRVFFSSSRENLEEQLAQENLGLGSFSMTAAQFLQQRLIDSPEVRWAATERGAPVHQERTPLAVTTNTPWDESSRATFAFDEVDMSSLERRRLELELGPGGDHDVAYHLALPASMPQALAWMRLLAKVHRGELQP